MEKVKVIECPRDAIQGLHEFIPTAGKIAYLNKLLRAGFYQVDIGSFVSPKAVPQMADTAAVLDGLDIPADAPGLIAIVANERGAQEACSHLRVHSIGYPFSVSETFQKRNTGAGIEESFARVQIMQDLCLNHGKELIIYLSMAFGNPYGDEYHPELVVDWAGRLSGAGISVFSLSDTVGAATPEGISALFRAATRSFPALEFGAHLHTVPTGAVEKLEAAWGAGCRRFDSAILGYGGCPMAEDELTGNLPTRDLVRFIREKGAHAPDEEQVGELEAAFTKMVSGA